MRLYRHLLHELAFQAHSEESRRGMRLPLRSNPVVIAPIPPPQAVSFSIKRAAGDEGRVKAKRIEERRIGRGFGDTECTDRQPLETSYLPEDHRTPLDAREEERMLSIKECEKKRHDVGFIPERNIGGNRQARNRASLTLSSSKGERFSEQ